MSVTVMAHGTMQIATQPDGSRKIIDMASGQGCVVGASGQVQTLAAALWCDCGAEFTSYVRTHLEPFPFSTQMMAWRDIDTLWPSRRLKLKINDGTSDERIARVVSWSELCCGPFSDRTSFEIKIEMEGEQADKYKLKVKEVNVEEGGVLYGTALEGMNDKDDIPFTWMDAPTTPVKPNTGACLGCQEPSSELKTCSRCKFAKYCGAECQKQDWPNHKQICNYVHRLRR